MYTIQIHQRRQPCTVLLSPFIDESIFSFVAALLVWGTFCVFPVLGLMGLGAVGNCLAPGTSFEIGLHGASRQRTHFDGFKSMAALFDHRF